MRMRIESWSSLAGLILLLVLFSVPSINTRIVSTRHYSQICYLIDGILICSPGAHERSVIGAALAAPLPSCDMWRSLWRA